MTDTQEFEFTAFSQLAQKLRLMSTGQVLPDDIDPVTLACSEYGLNIPLTPVQELILKLIGISHGYESGRFRLDEIEMAILLDQLLGIDGSPVRLWLPPRTSIKRKSGITHIKFESPVTLLLCVAGRRSGKTTIASILMSWLAWRILKDETYLDDIPVLSDSTLSLLNVACDSQQARILFRMLTENLNKLNLISDQKSPAERLEIGRLLIESLSSSARSSRGRTACGICFDEFAHFQRTNGPFADKAVWTGLSPSLATFGGKGLCIITTSPAGRSGKVWDLFCNRGKREGMLTLQLPTWVMNPNVSRQQLAGEFKTDGNLARQEYGAEFLAPHGTFLKSADVYKCVKSKTHPGPGKVRRHIHVDLGLKHDATAIALGYIESGVNEDDGSTTFKGNDYRIVIERVEVLLPVSGTQLNVGEIEKLIVAMAHEQRVDAISSDQHQSAYLIERLIAAGLNAMVIPATAKSNQESYAFLRDLISTGRIILPDNKRLIDELSRLECTVTPTGFRVEAPSGEFDDCADAVAMCVWNLARDAGRRWTDMFDVVEGNW